jgi:CBS domain containing-hemolysin-like protein
MTNTDTALVLGAGLLVLLAALFAGAESAFSRVSRVRVEELVRDQRRGAARLARVLADPPRYLNLVLLLRVAAELTATVLVTSLFLDRLARPWQAVALSAGLMVMVSYVVIGVGARTIGRQHADLIGLAVSGFVLALARVLGPLPRLLILLGNALTPGKGFREGPFTSEAELRDLVDLAEESRVIEHGEREMIHSVFELGDTIVREVMVPRTDIVFIERTKTLRQGLSLALRSGFSRIPVIGENEDDVVGIVHVRDLARRVFDHPDGMTTERVETIMRPVTFVPDSKPIDALLRELQASQTHLAIVIDEYGGTAGLVTIEDILEEIVGEITDEYDREEKPVEELPDGSVRVTARLPVEELAQLFDVELPTDDVETVGGLLGALLGRVPIPGATVEVGGLRLTAEGVKGRRNRIDSVLIRRIESPPERPSRPEAEESDGDRAAAEPVNARAS